MRRLAEVYGRLLAGLALALAAVTAHANVVVPGITGPSFNLVTGSTAISTPDGDSLLLWVYGDGTNPVQLPGPTLIVNQGDTVVVNLGGGESTDVILNTAGVAPGRYFLYSTNLNYLSNNNEDFGGYMTEIVIN